MKYYITPIAKLARYNIKIIFGNKFMYFILSAVGFYILTVGLNLISDSDRLYDLFYHHFAFSCRHRLAGCRGTSPATRFAKYGTCAFHRFTVFYAQYTHPEWQRYGSNDYHYRFITVRIE